MSAASTIAPARPSPSHLGSSPGSSSPRTRRLGRKRGTAQCMQALARANQVRLARAA